jgi:hypothetical protein
MNGGLAGMLGAGADFGDDEAGDSLSKRVKKKKRHKKRK